MAYEKRPGGHYLYLYDGYRATGTTIKRYIGAGVLVAVVAQQEVCRRRENKARRTAESEQRRVVLASVRRTLAAERAIRRALARELGELGYHQHARGQWRRIRRRKPMMQQTKRRAAIPRTARASVSSRSRRVSAKAEQLTDRALAGWLDLASQGNSHLRADLQQQIAVQRTALAKAGNTAVEKLLIERVLVCSLEVEFFDLTRANSRGISLRQARFLELRQAGAERRLAAALRTLAVVRRLLHD
jgi:hypothetical protein